MTDLTMGQRIARERKKLGISQEALGEHMGVSRQAISKWEADGTVPEIDKLIALSKCFGVSVGWLLGVEEQPEAVSAALSDEQLQTVEELVRRYQAPSEKRRLLYPLLLAGTVLAVIVLMVVLFRPSKVYTTRIANLEAELNGVYSQLSTLHAQLDTLTQTAETAGDPLLRYSFEMEKLDTQADLRFSGIPKNHQPGHAGMLRIVQGDQAVREFPCDWDGVCWSAPVERLPIQDGYQYFFVCSDSAGTEQLYPLEAGIYENLLQSSSLRCTASAHADADYTASAITFSHISLMVEFPQWLPEEVMLEDYGVILRKNGQEEERRSLFDLHLISPDSADISSEHMGLTFRKTVLREGDRLELGMYARLSNGMYAESAAGSWTLENSNLVYSAA